MRQHKAPPRDKRKIILSNSGQSLLPNISLTRVIDHSELSYHLQIHIEVFISMGKPWTLCQIYSWIVLGFSSRVSLSNVIWQLVSERFVPRAVEWRGGLDLLQNPALLPLRMTTVLICRPTKLPPPRDCDHRIALVPGFVSPHARLHKVLHKQNDEME